MPNRIDSPLREAARLATWVLRDIGRELRVARILAGLTQVEVARRLDKSASYISRVEHGLIAGIDMAELYRHAAVVGLKPYLKLFPLGRRVMDGPQLALWRRFRSRLADAWQVALEVPVPLPGDLRAADAVIDIPGCRCMVEVITRLADFQAQYRAATVKARDLNVDFIIFVLADTATNRRILREAGIAATDAFPLRTRDALRALGAGVSPGANAVLML
jgi:transcriptional regulator with XRE-family HTH domain